MSTTIRSIVNGLATRLATINGAGSYGTDLGSRVYKPWLTRPEGAQRPAVVIEGFVDIAIEPSLSNCGQRSTTIRVVGFVATDGANSDDIRADRLCQLEQDIATAIAADSTLGVATVHAWVSRVVTDLSAEGLKDGRLEAYVSTTWVGVGGAL